MQSVKKKLTRAIGRSQAAYNHYIVEKKYYQALRIRKANENVYILLEDFIYECEDRDLETVYQYLFHLEDWFNQFNRLEKEVVELNSLFVFNRLELSPCFPTKILEILKN